MHCDLFSRVVKYNLFLFFFGALLKIHTFAYKIHEMIVTRINLDVYSLHFFRTRINQMTRLID